VADCNACTAMESFLASSDWGWFMVFVQLRIVDKGQSLPP